MISTGLRSFTAATAWLAAGAALANPYNLPEPQSVIVREIYDLHLLIMWIIVAIFVVVFGAMTYAIIKHRRSVGHEAEQFHENITVEIIWTIIPFIILIGMAYPAIKTVFAMKDTSSPDVTIKATGDQSKWGYDYPREGISFYSNLATPRDPIENRAPKREHYLLEPARATTGATRRAILTNQPGPPLWP